eukprot:CAMPEP_0114385644 /NCGR_PEP_ID=MMETSP0102-20121206/6127_1 /TAXON_ID=38822 ORGANISM="Pteridomonas danica, Strain PT" /NCGR_SAMPLE_ID=MMETSP0102 /ASSEMBLY_ACC=CAM_ASM_000212 /LENGTH=55 /DNA_ID=CAMNT_0001542275 /DNA_START=351 /DNA_END=515 /DNA_ORIENTATION=+
MAMRNKRTKKREIEPTVAAPSMDNEAEKQGCTASDIHVGDVHMCLYSLYLNGLSE